MSARIDNDGNVTTLDGLRSLDDVVTPADVGDADKLAKLLTRLLAQQAQQKREFRPRRVQYQDIVSTGATMTPQTLRLEHGFGGRVVWWVCDTDVDAPRIRKDTSTDSNTLVLKMFDSGTFSFCVEEAG